ncbi:two-component system sensor histidine kinase NtrB [Deferrisoma palaeochoriense]
MAYTAESLPFTWAGSRFPELEPELGAAGFSPAAGTPALVLVTASGASVPERVREARARWPEALVAAVVEEPGRVAEAVAAGAHEAVSPDDPEALRAARFRGLAERARMRQMLREQQEATGAQLAAYMEQLRASQENLRDLYDELEEHTRGLEALVEAQRVFVKSQVPGEILDHLAGALEKILPGAETSLVPEAAEPAFRPTPQAWTEARVPVEGNPPMHLWVRSAGGRSFGTREKGLVELFAAQGAEALRRSRLYQALSVGKDEWERTFDAIPDTIAILDRGFRIRRANRALARLAGVHPRELIGRRCHEVLHGGDHPCPGCPVPGVFEAGPDAPPAETELRWNGRTYLYRACPLVGPSGEVVAAVAYARDVTRERELARAVERHEKFITVGQIAAGIAHEINNPLTAVSSYAQLLEMRLEEPKHREGARRIREGVDRIHRLVRNLMSFVRPRDEGVYPVDVNQVTAEALSFARYDLSRGNVRLVEELAPDLPKVLGNREELEQVLLNLLTNARDAVAGRGTIRVRTGSSGAAVWVEVEDDGPGIPQEHRERVFEPFFTTKPAGKGTGLGLFVALGIVRRLGGELGLEPRAPRGTVARVRLPAFRAGPEGRAAKPEPDSPSEGASA